MTQSQNFTSNFTVDQSPDEAFAAAADVARWWTGDVEGSTVSLGDEFAYRYPGAHYSKQKITELVPGKKRSPQVKARRESIEGN
jgi:hypothetical protein